MDINMPRTFQRPVLGLEEAQDCLSKDKVKLDLEIWKTSVELRCYRLFEDWEAGYLKQRQKDRVRWESQSATQIRHAKDKFHQVKLKTINLLNQVEKKDMLASASTQEETTLKDQTFQKIIRSERVQSLEEEIRQMEVDEERRRQVLLDKQAKLRADKVELDQANVNLLKAIDTLRLEENEYHKKLSGEFSMVRIKQKGLELEGKLRIVESKISKFRQLIEVEQNRFM